MSSFEHHSFAIDPEGQLPFGDTELQLLVLLAPIRRWQILPKLLVKTEDKVCGPA